MQIGYFWFVPANLRQYSALVALPCDDAVGADHHRREAWWSALADQSVRDLRRAGLPSSIAGRRVDAFPSGKVCLDRAANSAEINVDGAIAGRDYLAWVIGEFDLDGFEIAVVPASRTPAPDPVGPPKPWY